MIEVASDELRVATMPHIYSTVGKKKPQQIQRFIEAFIRLAIAAIKL